MATWRHDTAPDGAREWFCRFFYKYVAPAGAEKIGFRCRFFYKDAAPDGAPDSPGPILKLFSEFAFRIREGAVISPCGKLTVTREGDSLCQKVCYPKAGLFFVLSVFLVGSSSRIG